MKTVWKWLKTPEVKSVIGTVVGYVTCKNLIPVPAELVFGVLGALGVHVARCEPTRKK